MANKFRHFEFARYPKYKAMYIHAFDRMLIERQRAGKESQWNTGHDVFLWWLEDKNIEGQMSFYDLEGESK